MSKDTISFLQSLLGTQEAQNNVNEIGSDGTAPINDAEDEYKQYS